MGRLEERFQVARWIAEELAGTLSAEDAGRLSAWRKVSEGNEREYATLREEWMRGKGWRKGWRKGWKQGTAMAEEGVEEGAERGMWGDGWKEEKWVAAEWQRFEVGRRAKTRGRLLRRAWWSVAAVVLAGVGVGLWWRMGGVQRTGVEQVVAGQGIALAQGEVRLVLGDGREVALREGVDLRGAGVGAEFSEEEGVISYVAEVAAGGGEEDAGGQAFNSLVVPKGGEYKLVLGDGTRVWLNAETRLRYPQRFGEGCREVELEGEAYFEVARDEAHPFVVRTGGGCRVRVLGTRFNVAAYAEEESVVTTLAEGSVEVVAGEGSLRLVPDRQAVLDKASGHVEVREVDAEACMAWREGKFLFEELTLGQVMRQLQRWYDLEVFYAQEELQEVRLSGDLRKYEDFSQIARMIEEVADLAISIKGNCIVIGAR